MNDPKFDESDAVELRPKDMWTLEKVNAELVRLGKLRRAISRLAASLCDLEDEYVGFTVALFGEPSAMERLWQIEHELDIFMIELVREWEVFSQEQGDLQVTKVPKLPNVR